MMQTLDSVHYMPVYALYQPIAQYARSPEPMGLVETYLPAAGSRLLLCSEIGKAHDVRSLIRTPPCTL